MTIEELTKTLLELAEGKLEPAEWLAWWENNQAEAAQLLSRGEYLRIKPKKWDEKTVWRPIAQSQQGAQSYLESRQIPFRSSSRYQDHYQAESTAYCQAQEQKSKEQAAALQSQFPGLFQQYPKFAKSLQYTHVAHDSIGAATGPQTLARWENAQGLNLPEDIRLFFQTCNFLRLEGIELGLDLLRPLTVGTKNWWVLGEFWRDGDGDLLLFQPEGNLPLTPIYYYRHELNQVNKLCNSMEALLEQKLALYNRNHR